MADRRGFATRTSGMLGAILLADVANLLRVHQWSKNLLVLVPLLVGHRHGDVWQVLTAAALQAGVPGRGYRGEDWPLTLSFGIGAGLLSVAVMLLYLANDAAPSGFYPTLAWLYVIPAVITL